MRLWRHMILHFPLIAVLAITFFKLLTITLKKNEKKWKSQPRPRGKAQGSIIFCSDIKIRIDFLSLMFIIISVDRKISLEPYHWVPNMFLVSIGHLPKFMDPKLLYSNFLGAQDPSRITIIITNTKNIL